MNGAVGSRALLDGGILALYHLPGQLLKSSTMSQCWHCATGCWQMAWICHLWWQQLYCNIRETSTVPSNLLIHCHFPGMCGGTSLTCRSQQTVQQIQCASTLPLWSASLNFFSSMRGKTRWMHCILFPTCITIYISCLNAHSSSHGLAVCNMAATMTGRITQCFALVNHKRWIVSKGSSTENYST